MNKTLHINGQEVQLETVSGQGNSLQFTYEGKQYHFRRHILPDGTQLLEQEIAEGVWRRDVLQLWQQGRSTKQIQLGALTASITEQAAVTGQNNAAALSPVAPMPGLVRQILVAAGDCVTAGQPLAVMEAMKLQLTLTAGADAVVKTINVAVGDMIAEGTEPVTLAPAVSA